MWQITVIPEKASAYRDVASVEEVLDAHAPLERQRESWGSVPATLGAAPEPAQDTNGELARTVFVG